MPRKRTPALLAAVCTLSAMVYIPASAATTQRNSAAPKNCAPTRKLVPTCGAWWGIYPGATIRDHGYPPDFRKRLADLEKLTGRPFDIVHRYHRWKEPLLDAAERAAARPLSTGAPERILYLQWESQTNDRGSTGIRWSTIAYTKNQDAYIRSMARRVAAFPHRLFLEFDGEPEERSDANHYQHGEKDIAFSRAYRKIHKIFQQEGAKNVVWVWNVMGWDKAYRRYTTKGLYPGDDVVDWIGWDPYNRFDDGGNAGCGTGWTEPRPLIEQFASWLVAQRSTRRQFVGKPFMLSEYGSLEGAKGSGHAKGAWFRALPKALRDPDPAAPVNNIKAVVYFNQTYFKDDGSADPCLTWELTSTPLAAQGFTAAGQDAYLNQRRPT